MNKQNEYCIKKCQFLEYKDDSEKFMCEFYDVELQMSLSPSHNSFRPVRCEKCLQDDDKVTTNQALSIIENSVQTIKGHVLWLENVIEEMKKR